jgi:hypothetical protein
MLLFGDRNSWTTSISIYKNSLKDVHELCIIHGWIQQYGKALKEENEDVMVRLAF